MASIKHLSALIVLAVSAVSFAQDKIKIEPKWDKETKIKLKHKFDIQLDGHHAEINGQTVWSGAIEDETCSLTVHHDQLTILADDNEVTPPYEDYKISFNKNSSITKFSGGIDGSDGLRMLLVGHFFAPKDEMTKDAVVKWTISADSRMSDIHDLKLETTYLGTAEVGKEKAFKFKQVLKEENGQFATEGTYTVNTKGQVLKAEVTFKGMPIPAAGGDASGKFTASTIE